ncbi:SUMO protein smt3 [Gnomoniopsis smithogilvyi]|uniref:SUMO protein smt3 n=1 Tax=Gnomoniopsis smithogilvyi TaxID=1191159 RepID=A0A9W8Z0K5_9PEZI|nr:SUMO protein smt3 [Gnomoniopsis smithogilvyi]
MIAGNYEYERQPGHPAVQNGNLDDILIIIVFCFVCALAFLIFDTRRAYHQAQAAEEFVAPNTDDETVVDTDLIIVPDEEGHATGTNGDVTDNNNEVFFKIKRSTKLEKLMNAFCERQGKTLQSVRFLFEGQRVQPTDTPDTLEMQDGDTLEVHQEQVGGHGTLY